MSSAADGFPDTTDAAPTLPASVPPTVPFLVHSLMDPTHDATTIYQWALTLLRRLDAIYAAGALPPEVYATRKDAYERLRDAYAPPPSPPSSPP